MNNKENTNLTTCKTCGSEISKNVKKCPNCGEDQRNFFMRHKILTGIVIIALITFIFGGDDSPDTPTSKGEKEEIAIEDESKDDDSNEEDVQTEFKIGEVISYKDFDLIFENPRTVNGLSGENEYLILDATITSKTDNLTFTGDIQGVNAENEVIDDTLPIVSEDIGDPIMTAWTKTLNEGQKAKGYVAFDRPIEYIELRSSTFSNDVIKILID